MILMLTLLREFFWGSEVNIYERTLKYLIQIQVAVIVWDFLFIILKKYGNTLRYSRTRSLNDEALQPTI